VKSYRPTQSSAQGDALVAHLVTSSCASAQIVKRNADAARQVPGVTAVLLAEDLGGENASLPWRAEEPLLAAERVDFSGQPIALIVGESIAACRLAEEVFEIEFHSAPAVLSVEHALAMSSFHGEMHRIERGDPVGAMAGAANRLEGSLSIGSQVAFSRGTLGAEAWLESESSTLAEPGAVRVAIAVSAAVPSRVRSAVAGALGIAESAVSVEALPLCGLPGGKEVEAGEIAALAALAAVRTGHRVRLELTREQDSAIAGKRAAVEARFAAGFSDEGQLLAVDLEFNIDGGWTPGDSEATRDRVLLHADGAYHVANFRARCQLCKTHRVTSASLPAEGAAQAALVMEEILSRIAHQLSLPLEKVRQRNFYRKADGSLTTHYGQTIEVDALHEVWQRVLTGSKLSERRTAIEKWNATNPCYKRGIGVVPVKLGVGDPRSDRNQGTAIVQVLVDGSVAVQVGVAESGNGVTDRVRGQVSKALGVPIGKVVSTCGDLNALPHSTVAHAVDGAGLSMQAVGIACAELKERLRPVAAQLMALSSDKKGAAVDTDAIRFADEKLSIGAQSVSLADVVEAAWRRRIGLTAVGHYRTPKLWWDAEVGGGWPFEYFAMGGAVVEVQLDAFTGEVQVLRADLAIDLGSSKMTQIDIAEVTRAFQMGAGWQLTESLRYDGDGTIMNATAESYLPPGFSDAALDFRLHPTAKQSDARARTAAESPVVLAIAVREAVREAIRAFGAGPDVEVELSVPATPEAVLAALRDLSKRVVEANRKAAEAKAVEALKVEKAEVDKAKENTSKEEARLAAKAQLKAEKKEAAAEETESVDKAQIEPGEKGIAAAETKLADNAQLKPDEKGAAGAETKLTDKAQIKSEEKGAAGEETKLADKAQIKSEEKGPAGEKTRLADEPKAKPEEKHSSKDAAKSKGKAQTGPEEKDNSKEPSDSDEGLPAEQAEKHGSPGDESEPEESQVEEPPAQPAVEPLKQSGKEPADKTTGPESVVKSGRRRVVVMRTAPHFTATPVEKSEIVTEKDTKATEAVENEDEDEKD